MITLIQRVNKASLEIENEVVSTISKGLLLYVGFEIGDDLEKIKWSVNKIVNLRIFQDENEKMNKSLIDINGEILAISNFTLPADLTESGRRPSFTKSEKPEIAEKLYLDFIQECKDQGIRTEAGKFAAMMNIESDADGPVNFILSR